MGCDHGEMLSKDKSGFGATVISKLMKMGLKKNLYYEIKDVVVEERQDGVHAYKQKVRTKVYGLNSTKSIRQLLIDILIERVENHKDKIISPIIYNELLGMEIKRNGKVEHSSSTHDDQVFSMLMALYMWYEGVNMAERFGLRKTTIKTDDEIDEQVDYYNDDTVEIVEHFNTKDELDNEIERDLNAAIAAGGQTMQQFLDSSIDMFNNILDDYEIKRKFSYTDVDMLLEKYPYKKMKRAGLWELIVFGCPGNINIINSAIKKEMELGKSIFRILINFKLKKLYKYFKNDGTVITEGGKIFIFNEDAFKTLKYFKK